MVGLLDSQLSLRVTWFPRTQIRLCVGEFANFTDVDRHSGRIKLKDGNRGFRGQVGLKMMVHTLDSNDDVSLFAHSCKNTVSKFK